MIKDILLFLWLFIVPILVWGGQFLFSKSVEKTKNDLFQKIILGFYLFIEIFIHIGAIIMLIFFYKEDFLKEYFKQEVTEFLYHFCAFQIGILNMYFLLLVIPKLWYKWISYLAAKFNIIEIMSKQKGILGELCAFFILIALFFSFPLAIAASIYLMIFQLESFEYIFVEQKVPMLLIIFILLFNPIFMFYQLKERLFKNG